MEVILTSNIMTYLGAGGCYYREGESCEIETNLCRSEFDPICTFLYICDIFESFL